MSWIIDSFTRLSNRKRERRERDEAPAEGRRSTLPPHHTRELFGDIDIDRSLYPCRSAPSRVKGPSTPPGSLPLPAEGATETSEVRDEPKALPKHSASPEILPLPSRSKSFWQRFLDFVTPKTGPRRENVQHKSTPNLQEDELWRKHMDDFEDSMAFIEENYMGTPGFPDEPPILYADHYGYRDIARTGYPGLEIVVQRPEYPVLERKQSILDIYIESYSPYEREFKADPSFAQGPFTFSHNNKEELLFAAFHEDGAQYPERV